MTNTPTSSASVGATKTRSPFCDIAVESPGD